MAAESFHVSSYIREELEARGWTLDDLAFRMGGDGFGMNRFCLDMCMEIGEQTPDMWLGRYVSEALGRAFGCSADISQPR